MSIRNVSPIKFCLEKSRFLSNFFAIYCTYFCNKSFHGAESAHSLSEILWFKSFEIQKNLSRSDVLPLIKKRINYRT